jgi:hypothetical protein
MSTAAPPVKLVKGDSDANGPLDEVVRRFQQQDDERERILEDINREYALVIVGDRPAILRQPEDKPFQLMSVSGFHDWLKNITVPGGKGRKPASREWLEWPERCQYERITFDPSGKAPATDYNLWRGLAMKPVEGRCERFLDHIAEVVCDGDETLTQWVLGWFAQIVQSPGVKLGTALVLRGVQGAGKTIVGETIGRLLGVHYALASEARYVVGRFNSHLTRCLLLQLDEAVWAGDHAAAGKLKDLVTSQEMLLEMKGREPVRVPNFTRLLITSNHEWVIPAGLRERRFAVLDVSERRAQKREYFAGIHEELHAGGYEALLHHLLHYDLSGINLRQVPQTAALLEQQLRGLSPEQKWWLDVLKHGQLPGYVPEDRAVLKPDLWENYLEHAQLTGTRIKSPQTTLGIFLRNNVAGLQDKRPSAVRDGRLVRVRCYGFPPLRECREQFAALFQGMLTWDEDGTGDWEPAP